MTSGDESIGVVTNLPAPYRLPVFEQLSSTFDMTVYFCMRQKENRHWDPNLSEYSEWYEFLPRWQFGPLSINPTVYEQIVEGRYDAVLIADNANTIPATVAAYAAARRIDSAFGIWTEGIDTEYYHDQVGATQPIVERFRQEMYPRADVCFGYSEAAGEWFRGRGAPDNRIVTGKQVVPASLLPKDPGSQPGTDTTTICSLGSLEKRKGVPRLIKAFQHLDPINGRLSIAGDGPLRSAVEKLSSGDDRITIHGHVSEEMKASLLAAADIFVLPTLHDPWGLVVNEALHYGTPVVVTDMAASSELIRETGAGAILPDATVSTIQATLERVIHNPRLMTTFRQRAQRVTCASDVSVGARGFDRAFRHLLET